MPRPEWMNQYTREGRLDHEWELDSRQASALFAALAKGTLAGVKLYCPLHDDLYLRIPRLEVETIYEALRTGEYEHLFEQTRWGEQQKVLQTVLGIFIRPRSDEERGI